MKIQKENSTKINYLRNGEQIANQYALKSVTTAMIIIFLVWILTVIKVFLVDMTVTTVCFIACGTVYLLGMAVCKFNDMSKWWVKYFILLWVVVIITIVATGLTFHASLACLLPIVYTTMYSSKRMMIYTYILTVLSIIVNVYVGYYFGICDTNMVLLPGKVMADYIGADGGFTLIQINQEVWWTLGLFFVLPRCMIGAAFAIVCSNISKIIKLNENYARKMESQAETDGMTGLYNKSKYQDMVTNTYAKEENVAVIFWDINFLKKTNDTLGHEAGDLLIITIAESIQNVSNATDRGYRIGGDEFIMVMRGAGEKEVLKKIQDWEKTLETLKKEIDFPVSVSVGYDFGHGANLDQIIHKADQMMYENKRIMHEKMANKND